MSLSSCLLFYLGFYTVVHVFQSEMHYRESTINEMRSQFKTFLFFMFFCIFTRVVT